MGTDTKENKNRENASSQCKPVRRLPVSFNLQFSDLWENPELILSNMANSWLTKAGTVIPEFVLSKFPYIQAMTLIMLLAERALKMEKYPPMHPYIIYTVAGLCFLAGIMISARIKVKAAALLYTCILGYLAFNAYSNKQFNYSRHDRNRISSRHLGCMGVYFIYAFIKGNKESKILQRLGELCLATYLLGSAYLINESYEDKRALLEHIPGGNYARYFITIIFACAGVCFLSGYFLKDISMSMAFCLTFITFLIDMRFAYWTYRGMAYWNQVRLAVDNVNLLAGFFLFIKHYENLEIEERETRQREQEEAEAEREEAEEEEYKGEWHEKDE